MNNKIAVVLVLSICVITSVYVTYAIPTDEKSMIVILNLQDINKFLTEERDVLEFSLHQRDLEYENLKVDFKENENKIGFLENDIKYLQSELSRENEKYNQLVIEYELLDKITNKLLDMESESIIADWSGKWVTNVGHIDFTDNLSTPIAPLSIYSDGVDLFANTGGRVVNLSDIAP